MGFDNECILNIQSLAGEYFCPVCRLLVYPNEALQSQCTHLYCKPCLTYVVSTTRACPYDGYLVTAADSKPLIESNKVLAETIGKIAVHCLYHRSGCTWQGPLTECIIHCSGCAFGNSPVVCNRCGIQIAHRQVQEHAQNCPGVQTQAQQTEVAPVALTNGTVATADQTPTSVQLMTENSQAQASQTAPATAPGQDLNQQASTNSQGQAAVQAATLTTEQWYQQQQQQYQQYYQQYPGYDPYQQQYQQYYPYQLPQHSQAHPSHAAGQPQPQSQPQLQSQLQVPPQTQVLPQPPAKSQVQSDVQTPVTAQTQTQNQVQYSTQQQTYPAGQLYSHVQSQTHPPAHHQHPQPLSMTQAQSHPQQLVQTPQYQLPHLQMQYHQAPIQQQTHPQFPSQQHPVSQPQPHAAQDQSHLQSHTPQTNQAAIPNVQPQMQNPSSHAVSGHHSYPQPQLNQQMQLGAPQHSVHMVPQSAPQLQSQHPIPTQSQFPQASLLRPPQSQATYQNQQQPALLPSPGLVQSIPPAQHVPFHAQQPGQSVNQRPAMQSAQQHLPQQYVQQQNFVPQGQLIQQQMHIPSQLRPHGPPHSFPQHSRGYQQMQPNGVLPHGMQQNQSQNLVTKPLVSGHGIQSLPQQQSIASNQVRPTHPGVNQSSTNQGNDYWTKNKVHAMSHGLDEHKVQKGLPVESPSQKAEADVESLDYGHKLTGDKSDKSSNDVQQSKPIVAVESDLQGGENGSLLTKQLDVKEGSVERSLERSNGDKFGEVLTQEQKHHISVDPKQTETTNNENKVIHDGTLLKKSPPQEAEHLKEQSWTLQNDASRILPVSTDGKEGSKAVSKDLPQAHGIHGSRVDGYGWMPLGGQVHTSSFAQLSTSVQGPVAPSTLQAPPLGQLNHLQGTRSQAPGQVPHPGQSHPPGTMIEQGSAATFGRMPLYYGPPHGLGQGPPSHGTPTMSLGDAFGGHQPGVALPGSFDSHGQMVAKVQPHAPDSQIGFQRPSHPPETDMFLSQRPNFVDGRRTDSGPHGFVEHGPSHVSGIRQTMMRMNGPPGVDTFSTHGSDERFKLIPDERMKPFPIDPSRHPVNRGEFEEDHKKFPRPSHLDADSVSKMGSYPLRHHDQGAHGPSYDIGLSFDFLGGAGSSRFLPPHHVASLDAERPIGRGHPDFLGRGSGIGGQHVDRFAFRSPPHDYHRISSRGFGGHSGLDDIDGREFRRFGGPNFPESRFMHRSGFEGPGNLRMGERIRSGDFFGQDRHFGPRGLPGHLRLGEQGFGEYPGHHARMAELDGHGNFEPFGGGNRIGHLRLGEPGFRSSFPLQSSGDDGRIYAGDMEFDNSRKRKPTSMGWCRICKVDCETVEGLDLHSQTREHQKMAMDMVKRIKQNAKKQKLTSSDHSPLEDTSKSKNFGIDGRGKKQKAIA